MRKLLDTLSTIHKKEEASGGDFDATLSPIMAETYRPKMDKTVKNMKTMKPIIKVTRPTPQASISDVNLSMRSDDGAGGSDFTATMIAFQSEVADESFKVMQLVVRTMTGIFPKVWDF